jgi:hypothetical protein
MIVPEELVLNALTQVYGSAVTGIDLFKYSPAQIAPYLSGRIDADGILSLLRDLGMALTVVFGLVLVFVLLKMRTLNVQTQPTARTGELGTLPVPEGPMRAKWERVIGHLDSPREDDWKLAVIEADKLMDLSLSRAGYPGAGMGERLANMGPGSLASFDGLGWAHGVRNRLAHQVDYYLKYMEAKRAIGYYEQALNEIQAI